MVSNHNMNAVEELRNSLAAYKYGFGDLRECVAWAVERLSRNDDDGDEDVILLAGSTDESETKELAHKIVHRYLTVDALDEELWAGRLLVRLYERYRAGTITILALEPIVDALYRKLGHPDWLVMLGRNCEYATDVEPFVKPFEDEFQYISELWKHSMSSNEFKSKYDRLVSNTHDIK